MNGLVYVPDEIDINSTCVIFLNSSTLRVYTSIPTYNSVVPYYDFYLSNHYNYSEGVVRFTEYSTLPFCLPSERLTHYWGYRCDLVDILLCLAIIFVFLYFVLSRPFKALFRGWM